MNVEALSVLGKYIFHILQCLERCNILVNRDMFILVHVIDPEIS